MFGNVLELMPPGVLPRPGEGLSAVAGGPQVGAPPASGPAVSRPAIAALEAAVDALAAEDLAALSDRQLGADLVGLDRVVTRLQAAYTRRLAVFDAHGGAGADGQVSTGSWLRHHNRVSPVAAHAQVVTARRLADLPETAAAFAAGDIHQGHVRVITRLATRMRAPALAAAEPTLVSLARLVDPWRLERAARHLRHILDPLPLVTDERTAYAERRLTVSPTFGGAVIIDGLLDPVGGETLLTALAALEQADLAAADRADPRTATQRRADALVTLCRTALDSAALPDHHGARPHLLVTIPVATLRDQAGSPAAELAHTGPISAHQARTLACDAVLTRILTAGPTQPLDVGRAARVVPPAIRKALIVRDGGCTFPGCHRPVGWTDAHHVQHWADGGATSLDNLVLLCRTHHRVVHDEHLTRTSDGTWRPVAQPP